MARRLPSISALEAFVAAGRCMSFAQAASELNLTAGAISRQIQALEAHLGLPMFVRGHRKVTLTAAGAAYLAEAAPALAQLRAAETRARATAGKPAVAIVAYPTFAVRWLIPRWGRFLDAHPDIDLRLATSLNPEDFVQGEADIAIRVADPRALDGNVARKLFEVELFPVAAPALAGRLRMPGDLGHETLIHGTPRPDDWPRWLHHAGAFEVTGVARSLRFESLNLAYQAAIEGLGVAIAFTPLVADDLAAGRLMRPFDAVRRSGRALYLTAPQGRPATPERQTVESWLLAEAAASAG